MTALSGHCGPWGEPGNASIVLERLRSAAVVERGLPDEVAGDSLEIEVNVRNTGAGHSLPTSLVRLRRVWVDPVLTRPDDSVAGTLSGGRRRR